jgi:hypothetical protein
MRRAAGDALSNKSNLVRVQFSFAHKDNLAPEENVLV